MKKGLTELVMVLDKSGSMHGLTDDTIGGFNSMIEKQKAENGEVIVTTVLFNDMSHVIHDRFNIEDVRPMDESQYQAMGCTALLDAIGMAIKKEVHVQRNLPEESRAEKVIFVIITDGMENASSQYSYETIKRMIGREQEKYGWEFLFLGANIDAAKEGSRLGIKKERAVRYRSDAAGTRLNYNVVSEAVCTMRKMDRMSDLDESWKADIEADVAERGV